MRRDKFGKQNQMHMKTIATLSKLTLLIALIFHSLSVAQTSFKNTYTKSKQPYTALKKMVSPAADRCDGSHCPSLHDTFADLIARNRAAAFISSCGTGETDLCEALQYYYDDDYRQAASSLASYVKTHPESDIATLYLGLSHFQLGHYARAARMITPLVNKSGFEERNTATWYAAWCFFKFGNEKD